MIIVWEFKKMRIVYNILQNSKFEEQRINRERDVILKEMQEVMASLLCFLKNSNFSFLDGFSSDVVS